MNLHHGDLFWIKTQETAQYLELTGNDECDCLIIGGGMSGALISYGLVEAGYNTIVIDKSVPGFGSSAGNTGLIQYNSDKPLNEMIIDFGEQWAVDFYRFSVEAMTEFKRIAGGFDDVGFKPINSLFLCSKESDLPSVQENYAALKRYGFPVRWIDGATLRSEYNLNATAAIGTLGDAQINPFKLIQAIHTSNLQNKARIFKNASFDKITEVKTGYRVEINGFEIHAKNLIYATGYAPDILPETEPYILRNTTFSIVTEPLENSWGNQELIWDSAEPYIYFRVTEDQRLIAGGFDQSGVRFNSQAEIKKIGQQIYTKVKDYYPDLNSSIISHWQSVFGESKDGLPLIGRTNHKTNQFYCLAYGGNGTCYCTMASLIIRQYLAGEKHPYAYTTDLVTRSL